MDYRKVRKNTQYHTVQMHSAARTILYVQGHNVLDLYGVGSEVGSEKINSGDTTVTFLI